MVLDLSRSVFIFHALDDFIQFESNIYVSPVWFK